MAQIFNKIGQLGLGVALIGGVVNSALYNGRSILSNMFHFEYKCQSIIKQISIHYFHLDQTS